MPWNKRNIHFIGKYFFLHSSDALFLYARKTLPAVSPTSLSPNCIPVQQLSKTVLLFLHREDCYQCKGSLARKSWGKNTSLLSSLNCITQQKALLTYAVSVAQMTPVCSRTWLEQHNIRLFTKTNLKVQAEELPNQPSFMKLHAFPGRIQDQSLRACTSQWPFSEGCPVLACTMG